jgi:hypothetical protein
MWGRSVLFKRETARTTRTRTRSVACAALGREGG